MKQDLIIQELKAALGGLDMFGDVEFRGERVDSFPSYKSVKSRLRFVIATLEAKDDDTVRLEKP